MSDPIYCTQGVAIIDSLVYLSQTPGLTPVTGKIQANFTFQLSKDGVGDQSTTGITLTEVDSTNNPGEYSLQIAANAFPAVSGHYVLSVFDSTYTQFRWQWDFWVGNFPATTIGPALFTAVANNGRVTNGTNPVAGALVTLRTAAGVTYATAITDINGLWGSVNFPSGTATYTGYVNVNGYLQATFTITTSGSSAIGPGADVVLTVSTSTTGFMAQDLWAYARRRARNAAGSQSNVEIPEIVQDAMERLATAWSWNWYRRQLELQIHGVYQTGTLAVVNGSSTVTLSGGTLPAWAAYTDDVAQVKLKLNNQIIYVVSANIVAGTMVIDGPWMEASASNLAYQLYVDEYTLPTNMYKFGAVLPGQRWGWAPKPIGPEQLDKYQNNMLYAQKIADWYCIRQQNIVMSNYPAYDTLLRISYYARPQNLVNMTDIADWDPAHLRVLHRAIDCEVAIHYGGTEGENEPEPEQQFLMALADAKAHDRSPSSEASVLGGREQVPDWKRRNGAGFTSS